MAMDKKEKKMRRGFRPKEIWKVLMANTLHFFIKLKKTFSPTNIKSSFKRIFTKKNVRSFLKDLWRVIFTQITQSFTWSGMANVAWPVVIAALPVIITVASGGSNSSTAASSLVLRSMSTAVVLSFFALSVSNLRDRSTLDKNRIAYLIYGKQSVALGKVLGASIQFELKIVLSYLVVVIILAAAKWNLSSQDAGAAVIYLISLGCYFTMAQTGVRYIAASFNKPIYRGMALAVWIGLTLGGYLATTIVTQIQTTGGALWFKENQTWIAFVPFMNIGLADPSISNDLTAAFLAGKVTNIPESKSWPLVVMAVEAILMCVIVWKPFSAKLKTYLTV